MRRPARALRATALVLASCAMITGLTSCEKDDEVQQFVITALEKAMSGPLTFVHIDQDLSQRTTVSAEIADSLRYKLLLNIDGRGVWQQIVRDDAVANLFLDKSAVSTYVGAGSSPAVNVVSDYQELFKTLPPGLKKQIPAPPFGLLPKTTPVQPNLAVLAMLQGKWVLDKTGAPVLPTLGTSAEKIATTPFLQPLLMLPAVHSMVTGLEPEWIKKYSEDDLSPFFKPEDDPFPLPKDGEERYDVSQAPLPQITATSKSSRPDPPPDSALRKTAIYIKDGKVVSIRQNYDILDRLEDLARIYQIPLKLEKSMGTLTQQRIGQLIVQLVQDERPAPFRVHEEQLFLSYPAKAPEITLPSPVVLADLSVLPGQGKAASEQGSGGADDGGSETTAPTDSPTP